MTMTGTIEGKVHDRHGKEQIGAAIEVLNMNLITTTGVDGSYQIENVPAGEHQIKASMVLGSQTQTVNVPAHGTIVIDFTLNPLMPE